MVQVMGHEAVEGDKWIRKLLKERWMVQTMEEAIDGTSDGSRSSRRRYGSGSCRRSDQDAVEASIDVTGRKHMMMIG